MERAPITNHCELLKRIIELREEKEIQEVKLKQTIIDISGTLNLLNLFKKKEYKNEPLDLAKRGITMLIDLIIDMIFGKKRGLKGFISSVIIEKAVNFIIDNKFNEIISTITEFFKNKSKPETSQSQH